MKETGEKEVFGEQKDLNIKKWQNVSTLQDRNWKIVQSKLWPVLLKHITIVNEDSRNNRMLLQVVASPTIIILATLELSLMLLENCHGEWKRQEKNGF